MTKSGYSFEPESGNDGTHAAAYLTETDDAYAARIVRDYGKMISGACRKVLGGNGIDEEAAQETVMLAWQKRGEFRGMNKHGKPCSERTWLYRIAQNRAVEMLREESRRRGHEKAYGQIHPGIWNPPMPSEAYERRETGEMLWRAIERLTPKLKDTFLEYLAAGGSASGVAEATNSPEGTIRSRVSRARDMICYFLRQYGASGDILELVRPERTSHKLGESEISEIQAALKAANGDAADAADHLGRYPHGTAHDIRRMEQGAGQKKEPLASAANA